MTQTNQSSMYSKFDNQLLNYWRSYGGSAISVIKELARLEKLRCCIYVGFNGIVTYTSFMNELSENDKDVIKKINAYYLN